MWNWLKNNGAGFIAVGAILTFLHFFVVTPLRDESNRNFETLRQEMNQRFEAQDKYINQRFDAIDQRFDVVNQRFDAVNQRFDAQDRRIEDLSRDVSDLRGLSERVSRNEGQIDIISQQLQTAPAP